MIHRRFGRTELAMPVLSCGGMRYQHQWEDVPLDEIPPEKQANLEATVRRAVELGMNHVETARGYGSSERQLGQVLPQLPRDKIIVQTKIGPADDPKVFVAQFHESLDRLQLDHVDLLGIHGINTYERLWWTARPGGCLAAARELVAQGKARHVGFSTHGPLKVIRAAIAHEGDGGFDYVNLHWYYIFQHNWPAIQDAAAADMGVFIISPTDKGGMLNKPPQKLVKLCRPLHPIAFNTLFCLSHNDVHTISVGASKPEDFDIQVEAIEQLDDSQEALPSIEARLRQAMIDAVGEDLADRFDEGVKAWENTPGYVNIPRILWLRNLVKAYDMVEYGKMRYNLLGNGGHWFPGMTADHVAQLDLKKTIEASAFKDRIVDWLRETHELLKADPEKRLSQS